VAEGATIIAPSLDKAYYEKSFRAPSTLVPDAQAKNPKKVNIVGVTDKYVLTDGTQSIEVYFTPGDNHTEDMLIAYIPSAKAVVEADSYSPAAGNAAPPSPTPPNALNLYNNIQRLKLDVAVVIGIHGRGPVPVSEFLKFIGKAQS
jgi:glyoxylase-like metal-dependent hydrolase (beta-lactamase superfamily II)